METQYHPLFTSNQYTSLNKTHLINTASELARNLPYFTNKQTAISRHAESS